MSTPESAMDRLAALVPLGADLHVHLTGCGSGGWWAQQGLDLCPSLKLSVAELSRAGMVLAGDDLARGLIPLGNLDPAALADALEMASPGSFTTRFRASFALRRAILAGAPSMLALLLNEAAHEEAKNGVIYAEFSLGNVHLMVSAETIERECARLERDLGMRIRFLAAFNRDHGLFLNLLILGEFAARDGFRMSRVVGIDIMGDESKPTLVPDQSAGAKAVLDWWHPRDDIESFLAFERGKAGFKEILGQVDAPHLHSWAAGVTVRDDARRTIRPDLARIKAIAGVRWTSALVLAQTHVLGTMTFGPDLWQRICVGPEWATLRERREALSAGLSTASRSAEKVGEHHVSFVVAWGDDESNDDAQRKGWEKLTQALTADPPGWSAVIALVTEARQRANERLWPGVIGLLRASSQYVGRGLGLRVHLGEHFEESPSAVLDGNPGPSFERANGIARRLYDAWNPSVPLRIGHGLHLFATLPEGSLRPPFKSPWPMEVCLTSNEVLQAVGIGVEGERPVLWEGRNGLRGHPLLGYLRFGFPVVLGTDDPGIVRTALRRELQRAVSTGLVTRVADVRRLVYSSLLFAFDGERAVLLASLIDKFETAVASLGLGADSEYAAQVLAVPDRPTGDALLRWVGDLIEGGIDGAGTPVTSP